jgi:hypothetical protein
LGKGVNVKTEAIQPGESAKKPHAKKKQVDWVEARSAAARALAFCATAFLAGAASAAGARTVNAVANSLRKSEMGGESNVIQMDRYAL